MMEDSRQVRRAAERNHAKVQLAEKRIESRIAVRKAKRLMPLDRSIVRSPYPPSRPELFKPVGKDWKAIHAERERAKHGGADRRPMSDGMRTVSDGLRVA